MRQPLRIALLALSGAATTAAFPPYNFTMLYVLGLAVLIVQCRGVAPKQAAIRGFIFGSTHFLSGIYWVWISTSRYGGAPVWLGGLLWLALSSYLALFPAGAAALVSRLRLPEPWGCLLLWPVAWTLMELLRGWLFSGFPWLSAGYVLLDTPFSRWAPVLGSYGLTVVVMVLAASCAWLYSSQRPQRLWALLPPLILAGLWWLTPPATHWNHPVGKPVTAALVQGNVSQGMKWLPESLAQIQTHYQTLSERAMPVQWIIWPEIAIPGFLEDSADYFVQLSEQVTQAGSTVFVGVLRYRDGQILNSVTALGHGQPIEGATYFKRHLVPFGEYFPMPTFLKEFMWQLKLRYSDFTPGADDQPLLVADAVPVGLSICFEDAFGREIRRALPDAQVLVTVTNDGWFDDSPAASQHLQIARMRALEVGRELLRVSNRGVSAQIGAEGQILEQLEFLSTGTLVVTTQPRQGITPYTRWGDWPVFWGCLSILLGLLSYAVFVTASRRSRPHEHHVEP